MSEAWALVVSIALTLLLLVWFGTWRGEEPGAYGMIPTEGFLLTWIRAVKEWRKGRK